MACSGKVSGACSHGGLASIESADGFFAIKFSLLRLLGLSRPGVGVNVSSLFFLISTRTMTVIAVMIAMAPK